MLFRSTMEPGDSTPPEIDVRIGSSRPAVAPIDIYPNYPKAPRTPEISFPSTPTGPEQAADGSAPPSSGPPSQDEPSSSVPPARRSPLPQSDAARKLLARKMGHRMKSPAPGTNPEQVRAAVRADLKARYDGRKNEIETKIRQLLDKSSAARAAGDWSGAVASVRLAAELRPDDPMILQRLASIQSEADRALAPRFIEQGKYEEREGQYARAARSYERAARGKDSPSLFNKGAECLLHLETLGDTDRRMVVELARSAVTRDQQRPAYRITLARAYAAAGMKTSALGELKRALEIEPDNAQAKSLLKSLK